MCVCVCVYADNVIIHPYSPRFPKIAAHFVNAHGDPSHQQKRVALQGDYGVMIFADQRYARSDKRSKIPDWNLGSMATFGLGGSWYDISWEVPRFHA